MLSLLTPYHSKAVEDLMQLVDPCTPAVPYVAAISILSLQYLTETRLQSRNSSDTSPVRDRVSVIRGQVLRRRPSLFLALLTTVRICWSQVKLLVITTPRYFFYLAEANLQDGNQN